MSYLDNISMRNYVDIEQLKKRKEKKMEMRRPAPATLKNPHRYSMRGYVPTVYDQGQLGSCTANALAGCIRLLLILWKKVNFTPSRLWIYFYERLLEDPAHNVADLTDSGADVVDGCAIVRDKGVCDEKLFPYIEDNVNVEPVSLAKDASDHKITSYHVITPGDIKKYLLANHPVMMAFTVYQSFEDCDGNVPMPDKSTEKILGGHEMLIVGYDDKTQTYEVLNSWGPTWGIYGFCNVPYEFVADSDIVIELTVVKL